MTTSITAVQGTHILHGLLIDLTVNGTTYRIANSYNSVTWNGNQYTQLGHLLGLSEIQEDLRATNNSLTVSLSGIPSDVTGEPSYMDIVLNSNVKGSLIKIYRAFFNTEDHYLVTSNVFLRFQGYVSNYSISENWDVDGKVMTNTIALQCASNNALLERQYSGRRTNTDSFSTATDFGMYRVKAIANTAFDFGKPVPPAPTPPAPEPVYDGGGSTSF